MSWRELPTEEGASFDREVEIDAAELSPMVTWGTTPGMVVEVTDEVPDPAAMDSPADREAAERALAYMDLKPGTPDAGDPARAGVHRLLHQLPDLGPARGGRAGRGAQGRGRGPRRWSSPARPQVKAQAEEEGLRRGLPLSRLRVARVPAARCAWG